MVPISDNGMQHLSSLYSVPDALARVESLLQERGITIFCRVDHSGDPEKVGLKIHSTQLFRFASSKVGTPGMIAYPTVGIDLPLRAMIWPDADGKVWPPHNDPGCLQQRHNVLADVSRTSPPRGQSFRTPWNNLDR